MPQQVVLPGESGDLGQLDGLDAHAATVPTLDFEQLHRAHRDRLVNYAGSIIGDDRHGAEDAAQEAWVRAWELRGDWTDVGKPALAWLQRLTRFAALTEIRRWKGQTSTDDHKRHRVVPLGRLGELLGDLPEPDNGTGLPGLADPETVAKLTEVWLWLTPKQGEALTFYCLEGYSYDEAARLLGCDVNTVRSHVNAGLERIRRYFLGEGFTFAHECPRCGWPVRSVGHRTTCR